MKRTIVLIGVLLLLAFGLSAQVTLSGGFSYGFITDLDKEFAEAEPEGNITVTAVVEEIQTIGITLLGTPSAVVLDDVTLATDIGSLLELPVDFGLALTWDIDGALDVAVSVWQVGFEYDFDFDPYAYQHYFGVTGSFAPIAAEVYLDTNGMEDWFGLVGANVDLTVGAFTAGIGAEADISEAPLDAYSYDANAYYTLGPVGFGGTVGGRENSAIDQLSADLDLVGYGGIDVFVTIDLSKDEALDAVDASVYVTFYGAELRVGYLMTEIGVGDENAPAVLPDGGLYLAVSADY